MKSIIVTGAGGLIGSEVVEQYTKLGYYVHGVDNNQRRKFFGPLGDITWRLNQLKRTSSLFKHHDIDIRDRSKVLDMFKQIKPEAVVHTAAQPSHDMSAGIPFDDFDINAVGTLNLLEATRTYCKESPFVHMSTNKVYGDLPNELKMEELDTRWTVVDDRYINGIPETFSIDQSKHSLFGASKVAADIMVQEYGRYFDMPTCCLRGGCLTGPTHSGVELHGFLNYLVRCHVAGNQYTIYGYKGKQVRDNIHSKDVVSFIKLFVKEPRAGEVYNIGGGMSNSCSVIEAFDICEQHTRTKSKYTYTDTNRIGDHICYYSDLTKIKEHYPSFEITISLNEIFEQIIYSQNKSCLQ